MKKHDSSLNVKERILNTADILFYEQGYHKTGVNQLIGEANVAKASFYAHFSSKKILLKEYLNKRHNDWFEGLHQTIDSYENPKNKILGLFEFLEQWIKETNYRGCAFINIKTELPDDKGEVTTIVQNHKQQLRQLIKELTGDLNTTDHDRENIDLVSDTIYLLLEAAIVESQNFNEIWPVKKARKSVVKLVKC